MSIQKIRKNYGTAIPLLANEWWKYAQSRENRIGLTLQNQTLGPQGGPQAANFWVADSPKARLTDAQYYAPGTGTIEDLFADQGEIWVYTDVQGAGLTVVEKFVSQ